MSAPSKGPPIITVAGHGNDVTLEIVDPYPVNSSAEVVRTLQSKVQSVESSDSTLIRIRDGQTVQVIDPRRGLLPEERYRFSLTGEGELGKGGIGQVHLVFDNVLGREVALKVLRDDFRGDGASDESSVNSEVAWRFMREARVTGQLEHPNIVPVYELGRRTDGSLYYTMRAVRGRTLGEAIRSCETFLDRLTLLHHFADVCQAIGYAHSRGVLHRDLKPENIMIGEYGETFVLDWGLARIQLRSESGLPGNVLSLPPSPSREPTPLNELDQQRYTAVGRVVGTPQYMSPEQITSPSDQLDPRSDVWSLGVVLYAILTGRTPFQGNTVVEILSNVLNSSVGRPSVLEPLVPPELEAITLRALERDKTLRYSDAGEIARDIVAFQSGARVGAYAYGSMELLRRFARRHRQAVIVAAMACLALVAMAVTSYLRVRRARDNAVVAEKRAIAGQRLANLRYADVLVEKARTAAAVDDSIAARFYAAEALSVADRPEARGLLVGLSNAVELRPTASVPLSGTCEAAVSGAESSDVLCTSRQGLTYYREGSPLWFVAAAEPKFIARFGADNSAILAAERRSYVISNRDGRLLYSGETPLIAPTAFAAAPDEHWLAAADAEGNVVTWQPEPGGLRRTLKWGQSVTALVFSRNSHSLIIGGSFGRLGSWDFSADRDARAIGETHTTVGSLVVGPRAVAIAGGSDGTVSIWDLAKQQLLGTVLRHDSAISALAISANGRWLATSTRSKQVDLIDLYQRARVFTVPEARGPMTTLGFDQESRLWLLHDGTDLVGLELVEPRPKARMFDRSNVLSLAWSTSSELLYAGGLRESGVCVFRLSDGECADRIPVRLAYLRVIAQSPDDRFLVFAGAGKTIEVWDAKNRIPLAVADVPVDDVRTVVFDTVPDRAWLAGNAPFVLEIGMPDGKVKSRFAVDGLVQSMAMISDSRSLLLGLRDGRLQLRQMTGALTGETKAHGDWVTGLGVFGTSKTVVSVGADGRTVFSRLPTLEVLSERREHQGRATSLAVSSDGTLVATAGEDPVIVVSEAQMPWQVKLKLQDHHGTVRCLAFDPSSRRLASGGDDATVRLWNLQTLDLDVDRLRAQMASLWQLKLQGSTLVAP